MSARLPLAVVACALASCRPPPAVHAPTAPAPESHADRIARVERGLLPTVLIEGRAIDGRLEARMRRHNVPGVSVAVIDGHRLAWAKGYGTTRADGDNAVIPATLFQAASVSKVVTAVGVLALVGRGRLDLDEDVNRRLRSWRVPENEHTRSQKVTLRRLLSHGAGLNATSGVHYPPGQPVPSLVQILEGMPPAKEKPARVEYVPGTRVQYANAGFTIIELLMDDVTGQPFAALMRQLVLDPVGASYSRWSTLTPALRAHVAAGHDDRGLALGTEWHIRPELAAGGLRATPADLARVALAIMRAATGDETGPLPPALARLMLTRANADWGLGVELSGDGPTLAFRHSGWNDGFKCSLVGYPARGQGAVVMSNGEHGGRRINDELLRALAREYGWPDFQPTTRRAMSPSADALATLTGVYDLMGRTTFSVQDGELFFAFAEAPRERLFAASATEFFMEDERVTFTFQPASVRVTLNDGSTVTGRRLP